jgi:hypothetical protein
MGNMVTQWRLNPRQIVGDADLVGAMSHGYTLACYNTCTALYVNFLSFFMCRTIVTGKIAF